MVDAVDVGSDGVPWSADECALCVTQLREFYVREKRTVRNWNEGHEGEPSGALGTVLKALYLNRGSEEAVGAFVDAGLVTVLLGRLRQCPPAAERPLLKWGLYACYAFRKDASARAALRLAWGKELKIFVGSPNWRWLIGPIVGAIRCVVDGHNNSRDSSLQSRTEAHSSSKLEKQIFRSLAIEALVPLLRPNEFAEWRDQIPLVATYSEEVGACILSVVRAEASVGSTVLKGILEAWPPTTTASTSKEVLLLGQLEDLLCARRPIDGSFVLADDQLDQPEAAQRLHERLSRCVGSENWRLCERALHMWRRSEMAERLGGNRAASTIAALLPALLRSGTPHWNPTVNRMTLLVLDRLELMDAKVFNDVATAEAKKATAQRDNNNNKKEATENDEDPTTTMMGRGVGSLAADMRGWRPDSGAPPPMTLTGAAPWATKTVAMPKRATAATTFNTKDYVASYREACAAVARESSTTTGEETEARAQWAADLVAEQPARLPELKFHDLVFGRELGSGAFGVVKYAKRIVRQSKDGPATLGRAHWPEFAVKVISKIKVKAHDYARSIAREIGALQQLDHPGIARLVSAFKWRGDAYLVIEYAAGGDLHNSILDEGALTLESAQFVLGSVVAAIESVHDKGLVFADLKPENVILTAAGHVKLTDFGGCRGATPKARQDLHAAAKRALADLRDGDWRPSNNKTTTTHQIGAIAENRTQNNNNNIPDSEDFADAFGTFDDDEEDDRVEGTLLYSPPEVACLELRPTMAADIWAIGCFAHFCLEARPRIEANDDEAAKKIIANFDAKTAFFAPTTPQIVRDLEISLLEPAPSKRPTLLDLGASPFFENVDIRSIYRRPAPKLKRAQAGSATAARIVPPHDALWAQRQYSRIWAPLGAGSDLPGAAASAAVDGVVIGGPKTATGGAVVNVDLLGPWVQPHPIPELPADTNMPFFLTTDKKIANSHTPPTPSTAVTPAVPPYDAAANVVVLSDSHHDEPLDAIVESD